MADSNALVLRPHPFSQDSGVVRVPAGESVRQMLERVAGTSDLSPNLRVEVGGYEVPCALWGRVRPKQGTAIHVTVMPAGGGGKKWIRTILMIVVAVVAMWVTAGGASAWLGAGFAAGTSGAAMLGAAVYMVGDLRVPALAPEVAR